jgi:hypothetical protein
MSITQKGDRLWDLRWPSAFLNHCALWREEMIWVIKSAVNLSARSPPCLQLIFVRKPKFPLARPESSGFAFWRGRSGNRKRFATDRVVLKSVRHRVFEVLHMIDADSIFCISMVCLIFQDLSPHIAITTIEIVTICSLPGDSQSFLKKWTIISKSRMSSKNFYSCCVLFCACLPFHSVSFAAWTAISQYAQKSRPEFHRQGIQFSLSIRVLYSAGRVVRPDLF